MFRSSVQAVITLPNMASVAINNHRDIAFLFPQVTTPYPCVLINRLPIPADCEPS